MELAPAEQVRQALAFQGQAYEMLADAKKVMNEAQKLIGELKDAHGRRFICGGELYTIDERGCDGRWAYGRSQLKKDKDTPVIDRRDTVPEMPHDPRFNTGVMEKFKRMIEAEKPVTIGDEIYIEDAGGEVPQDECETQRTPPPKGSGCY